LRLLEELLGFRVISVKDISLSLPEPPTQTLAAATTSPSQTLSEPPTQTQTLAATTAHSQTLEPSAMIQGRFPKLDNQISLPYPTYNG
jgi:hypothetical protein